MIIYFCFRYQYDIFYLSTQEEEESIHLQSPLHQLDPCPWGHSAQEAAWWFPQLTWPPKVQDMMKVNSLVLILDLHYRETKKIIRFFNKTFWNAFWIFPSAVSMTPRWSTTLRAITTWACRVSTTAYTRY